MSHAINTFVHNTEQILSMQQDERSQCFSKSLEDRADVSVDAGSLKEWTGRTLTLFKNKLKFESPVENPYETEQVGG